MLRFPLPGLRRIVVVLVAGAGALAAPSAATAAQYEVDSASIWKTHASPMGWSASQDRILYNQRGADGMFDGWSAKPDGSDERCLTCTVPVLPGAGVNTHRGVGDVDPSGDLMLLDVERGVHVGTIGAGGAEPGKGAYSDVWLARTDGSAAWPLTDIYAKGSDAMGTIWPRFDRTGTRVVWAELYAPPILNLGAWRLKVADIVWDDSTPHLENVKSYQPVNGKFFEPYGFSPDNSRILFTSDMDTPSWYDSQIFSIAADFSGPAQRLTPSDPKPGWFTNYNEFAYYVPQGDYIMYGSTAYANTRGLEFWMMRPDGSDRRRLTYFNEPWNLWGENKLFQGSVGGIAFDPHDPNRFVVNISRDMASRDMDAAMVQVSRYEQPHGLKAQYFADQNFSKLVLTRTENPSVGFYSLSGSPAPGVPTNFSARWTGTIVAPVSGTYQFCARADDGIRLWLDGARVLDVWTYANNSHCAAVQRTAGQRTEVRLDYHSYFAPAYMQLFWIPPTAAAGQQLATAATPATGPGSTVSASPIPAAQMIAGDAPAAAASAAAEGLYALGGDGSTAGDGGTPQDPSAVDAPVSAPATAAPAAAAPTPAPRSTPAPTATSPGAAQPVRLTVPRQTLRAVLRAGGFKVLIRARRGGRASVSATSGRFLRARGATTLGPGATVRLVAKAPRAALRRSAGRRVTLRIGVRDRGGAHHTLRRTVRVGR